MASVEVPTAGSHHLIRRYNIFPTRCNNRDGSNAALSLTGQRFAVGTSLNAVGCFLTGVGDAAKDGTHVLEASHGVALAHGADDVGGDDVGP